MFGILFRHPSPSWRCAALLSLLAACGDDEAQSSDAVSADEPTAPEPAATPEAEQTPESDPVETSSPASPSATPMPVEPEPSAPECGGVGRACAAHEDCCDADGLICQQLGMCCASGKGGNNVNCGSDDNCCSGTCGVTQDGSRGCCSDDGAACRSDSDCCSDKECALDLGAGLRECCAALGGFCEAETVCCGGGRCGSACRPLSSGTGCSVTSDVCCRERGASCTDDSECCHEQGIAECSGGVCCGGSGAECTSSDECCGIRDCVDGACSF